MFKLVPPFRKDTVWKPLKPVRKGKWILPFLVTFQKGEGVGSVVITVKGILGEEKMQEIIRVEIHKNRVRLKVSKNKY